MGMGILWLALSFAAARLSPPAFAKPADKPAAQESRKDKRHQFEVQLQAERDEFRRKQTDERKAFRETLHGKSAQEKKAKLDEFNARQKEELKAFRQAQRAKRREFEEGQKAAGAAEPATPAGP